MTGSATLVGAPRRARSISSGQLWLRGVGAGRHAPERPGMHTTAPSPSSAPGPVARPVRSLAPDIARGLMLALIAVANVSWLLWGHDGSVGLTPHVPAQGTADSVLQFAMTVAVDHRAMPLFAFLFGYGMVQFHRSRTDRGIQPRIVRVMMRRRHWAMVLLGLLHAALLFSGDVLGAYGVAALLLVWIFFDRRDRTVLIWICVIAGRSEEHTSELQSRGHLVCRLLLEKKNVPQ